MEKGKTRFKEFTILWTLMQKSFEEGWTKEAKIISLYASSGCRLWDERRVIIITGDVKFK